MFMECFLLFFLPPTKAESWSCQLHFNMPTHASNRLANLFKLGKQMSVVLDKKKNTKSHGCMLLSNH